jgi:hypothetical protein
VVAVKYADDNKVTDDVKQFLDAVERYNREMDRRGTWRYRAAVFLSNLWGKIWGGVVLIVATSCLALGLSL